MKHYIIVKWNESFEAKEEQFNRIESIFNQAKSIEGIKTVDFSKNIIERDNRFDYMIAITMDKSALNEYDSCVYHKQWKDEFGKYIKSKVIFDSED